MRKITIHDDLTHEPVAEEDSEPGGYVMAADHGTFEGTVQSVKKS